MSVQTASRNDDAAVLRYRLAAEVGADDNIALLDDALIQERRRTVAAIRERLNEAAISMRGWQDREYRYIAEYRAAAILDEAEGSDHRDPR
jgi:hypothetical protein